MTETLVNQTLTHQSNFTRLGQRNYVQGSTLVQGLLDALDSWQLGKLEQLKIACHTMLNEQGTYELVLNQDAPAMTDEKIKHSSIVFESRCDGHEYVIVLNGNGKEVDVSIPYNEETLVEGYIFQEPKQTIEITWSQKHPLMQMLIALNKVLLDKTLPSNNHGKWIFYKSDLSWAKLHCQSGRLALKLRATIGLKSALSDIFLDGENLGNIFFTRPEL
jgi:hypothetical protein